MVRVLHVYKDFRPEGGGGVARHIHGLAQALCEHGAEVAVAAPGACKASARYSVHDLAQEDLKATIQASDVVHVHGARTRLAFQAALLARRWGKPFVYTPHCYYDGGAAQKRAAKAAWDLTAERWMLRTAATTILLSPEWADYLGRRRLQTRNAVIVPNCVLVSELRARVATASPVAGRLDGEPALLTVGRLDPVKRICDAIKVLAMPQMERAVLHVVGSGQDRDRLEAIAQAEGVADRVVFHGFLTDAQVASLAQAADVFVMPSEREGLPTVLIEMAILGLPIACSAIDGNLAVAGPLKIDSIFPVGDIGAFARAIQAAGRNPVPSPAAEDLFAWERWAGEVLDLYRRAALTS